MMTACERMRLPSWSTLALLLIVLSVSSAICVEMNDQGTGIYAIESLRDSRKVTVHFIDVGFGDSIYIETSGKNVLIDGGLPDAGNRVLNYLESLNVTRIDLMIATHPHEDHVGGLITTLNSSISVDQVLFNNDTKTNNSQELYLEFLTLARDKNLTVACRGQVYKLTESANLTVLNPVQPFQFNQSSSTINEDIVNANSIVVRLQAGNTSFLFTGDAEARAEQSMLAAGLDLRSDVLKVGHHGLRDASTSAFLDKVKPCYAVVTASTPSKYGLAAPDLVTVDNLLALNVTMYGTQVHGTVKAATDGNTISFPDFPKPETTELDGHAAAVYAMAWSPRGNTLAIGSKDGTVILWDTLTWGDVLTIKAHQNGVWSLAWSPDGTKLATAGVGGACVWDPETAEKLVTLGSPLDAFLTVYSVSFSPDGKLIATGSSDGSVNVFDPKTGEIVKQLAGHTLPVIVTAWSPNGKYLASGSIDRTTIIWDVQTWSEKCVLRNYMPSSRNDINGLAWSPDGTMLATAGQEGNIHVWDVEAETDTRMLSAHLGWARGVAWSPNGSILATSGQDASIRLWNSRTGELVADMREHYSPVWSIAWSPDGSLLASGSGKYDLFGGDTRVLMWKTGEHLKSDLNWDGVVSMMDLTLVAESFGSRSGGLKWNQIADVDKNELVDMRDLVRIAKDFGVHTSL